MTGSAPLIPGIVAHYGAYLRAKSGLTPEINIDGAEGTLTIGRGDALLTLDFARRKQRWQLRRIEVTRSGGAAEFSPGELAKAVAALLGAAPVTADPPSISGTSGPPTDAALRGKRQTVLRI